MLRDGYDTKILVLNKLSDEQEIIKFEVEEKYFSKKIRERKKNGIERDSPGTK